MSHPEFVKFETLAQNETFHSRGITYTKLGIQKELTQDCKNSTFNASYKSDGIVRFAYFDDIALVRRGVAPTTEVARNNKVIPLFSAPRVQHKART